jgi:hypothetical protein
MEVFKINTAYKMYKIIIGGILSLAVLNFAWDIFVFFKTNQMPDFGDTAFKLAALIAPAFTYVLGTIFGKPE